MGGDQKVYVENVYVLFRSSKLKPATKFSAASESDAGALLVAILLQLLTLLPVDATKLALLRSDALDFWFS